MLEPVDSDRLNVSMTTVYREWACSMPTPLQLNAAQKKVKMFKVGACFHWDVWSIYNLQNVKILEQEFSPPTIADYFFIKIWHVGFLKPGGF